MKRILVSVNWALSFMCMCADTEQSSLAVVLVIFAWFFVSTMIMIPYANEWSDKEVKQLKMD